MALTLVQQGGLTTMNTHLKYESPITHHSKFTRNVKEIFADKWTNRLTDKQTTQKLYTANLSMQGHKNTDADVIPFKILFTSFIQNDITRYRMTFLYTESLRFYHAFVAQCL